ncbi:glucosamine inositolphosphorylceramide transferase family protein [Paraburkholderia metrosideri]|uniref:Glucosamine inositolphosphorylceramide transferase 1 N-terminal domain-containing protein n=1 Tax=Paraburkholderia metrosideri TaxID=580937 RepID=A0ABN7HNR8_9BURK|nr:hypothetical protein [Paraburkholderia metrosideri]CAD6524779.1 hypothetical protein LMG28140_01683 [Paraburkholderia metrosideri]
MLGVDHRQTLGSGGRGTVVSSFEPHMQRLTSTMNERNIRVGLLLDDTTVPVWIEEMIKLIAAQQGIEVVLTVKYSLRSPSPQSIKAAHVPWSLSIWMALDKRLMKVRHDAFRMVDLSPTLSKVPMLNVDVERKQHGDVFGPGDVARIADYGVTVLLSFGPLRPYGDIFEASACGIWSHVHGEDSSERTGPVGAWDILLNRAATSTALQFQLRGDQCSHLLQRSWSRTYPFSIHRNRSLCYWKTVSFASLRLRELQRIGEKHFNEKYAGSSASSASHHGKKIHRATNVTCLWLIHCLLLRSIAKKLRDLRAIEQWMLLYQINDEKDLPRQIHTFQYLVPPKDRFWADPFVVERGGQYVAFIEELEYARKKGHISVIYFDLNEQPVLPPTKVLERPYHLSYPFMLEDNGELYMIPETHENRTIELYRCVNFPDQWEHVMNLMNDVMAVDTTIWHHAGKYWLFAGMHQNEHASSSEELFLFWADTLVTDEWHPHPSNPIVSDARCARPAGAIFYHDGHWYRPAQDCTGNYGRALSFQRIDVIDETSYKETAVSRIDADWDDSIERVHTFNRRGRLTFIDGMKTRA